MNNCYTSSSDQYHTPSVVITSPLVDADAVIAFCHETGAFFDSADNERQLVVELRFPNESRRVPATVYTEQALRTQLRIELLEEWRFSFFFLYGRLSDNNPHLRNIQYDTIIVTPQELASLTEGKGIFIEKGMSGDEVYHKDGPSQAQIEQLFRNCTNIRRMGRVWWIPLDQDATASAVLIPTDDGNYKICATSRAAQL
jgi:hypothetical protein